MPEGNNIHDSEVLDLFHGLSDSMQTAIVEIMRVTQDRKTAYSDYRHRIVAAAFEIEKELESDDA